MAYKIGSACVACGACAAQCPVGAIEDKGGVGIYHGEPIPDTIFKSKRQEAGDAACTWE